MRITTIRQLFFTLAVVLTTQTGFTQHLEWAHVLHAQSVSRTLGIAHGKTDGIYQVGFYEGTCDFDPGTGVHTLTGGGTFINKLNDAGDFVWAKRLDVSIVPEDIVIDSDDNIFISGNFTGIKNFNPSGSYPLTSAGDTDFFILKLDKDGNFQWAKSLGTSEQTIYQSQITVDQTGNLIFVASIIGATIDVDPGAGVHTITNNAYAAVILKLSANGDFVWARQMTSDSQVNLNTCDVQSDGSIITSGVFYMPLVFDPTSSSYTLDGNSVDEMYFIHKLDASGNFQWAKEFNGIATTLVNVGLVDDADNIYVSGINLDNADFDPGPSVKTAGNTGLEGIFLEKFDANGNFQSVNFIHFNFNLIDIATGPDKSIYLGISGDLGSTPIDLNPGTGVRLTETDQSLISILKFSEANTFMQAMVIYDTTGEYIQTPFVCINSTNDLFLAGFFEGAVDLDPSASVHIDTAVASTFMIKLKQLSCDVLSIVADEIAPVSCISHGNINIHAENGETPYSYSWAEFPAETDSVVSISTPGLYSVSVTANNGCSHSASILIEGSETNADLNVSLIGDEFRPGYITEISLDGFNQGCTPADGQLICVIDPQTTASDFDPTPDNISGDTISWDFSSLTYESTHMLPKFNLLTSTGAQIGDSIHLTVSMTKQAGDPDSTNNFRSYLFPVVNGFDPNHKSVYPAGECTPHLISNDQRLTYTVQFQNTGNADARNIFVLDSLDSNLDVTTLRITGSSDTMWTEVLPGNTVKFHFDDIYLADSTSNEPESHGYVVFSVAPVTGIIAGATITNNVGIYFDFNPPIYTNEVFNTISDGNNHTSSTLTATGIDQYTLNGTTYTQSGTFTQVVPNMYGCDSTITLHLSLSFAGLTDLSNSEINVFPNPFNEQLSVTLSNEEPAVITLTDLQGKTVIPAFTTTNTLTILPTKELAGGVYFLKVSQQGTERRMKIVKN